MNIPVLLLPGWGDDDSALRSLSRFLTDRGWSPDALEAAAFLDPRGSNITHAQEIAAAAERLRARSGARQIDVVAHSMSGLALRWFIAHAGASCIVRRAIFVATPHRGTWLALAGWGEGAREMRPRSPFLRRLDALELPAAIRTFTIRTLLETHVFPHRNATLPGATDHVVRATIHARMLYSRPVMRIVHDCLIASD